MDRAWLQELLRGRIGLDPNSSGAGLVARAVQARMNALKLGDGEADRYRALVEASDHEFDALVEEVVVPESWFFRDELPFSFLAARATDRWAGDPERPPFRALCVPCARGEEPYSVAIALIDAGLPASRFHVDAVDLSRAALGAAERAVYTGNSFRTRDLGFRDRHFSPAAGGYRLSPRVKAAVAFHQGNLLDPGLLAGRPGYDAIFCRNLLIYLDEPARRRAVENLDRLLGPGGALFVGHAEQISLLRPRFRPVGPKQSFAYERAPGPGPAAPVRPAARARAQTHPRRKPGTPPTAAAVPARRTPAPAPPPTVPPPHEAPTRSLLAEAAALADQGRHAEAAGLCEQENRRKGPSSAAFYLLGVVRQAAGDRAEAERCYEKAVYLDPGHEDALVALSLLAQRRGDAAAAAGYLRRAERAAGEETPR